MYNKTDCALENTMISAAYIFGAGAQGRVTLDVLRSRGGYSAISFVDENVATHGSAINECTVVGGIDCLKNCGPAAGVVIALGNPYVKQTIAERFANLNVTFLNAVHPNAWIAASALIGKGSTICAMAVVNSNAHLGDHTIVNTATVVEHDTVLGDFTNISPGVQLGARVVVGDCVFIGMGAIVLPRVKIGAGCVIAAGSLVTKDLPENVFAKGWPARVIEKGGREFDYKRIL